MLFSKTLVGDIREPLHIENVDIGCLGGFLVLSFAMLPYSWSLVRCVIDSLMCIVQHQLVLCSCLICSCHKINKYYCIFRNSRLYYVISWPSHSPQFLCTVVAILLHYFFMSTFAWMFVEGLHIYRMQTEQRNINYGAMRFYYAIGWGVPAIITGLSQTQICVAFVRGMAKLPSPHTYALFHMFIHTHTHRRQWVWMWW